MKCPVCGAVVEEGLAVCPACRADLSATRQIPRLKGTWCSSCGALVPEGAASCPKCGMPAAAPTAAPNVAPERAAEMEQRRLESEQTTTLPRIESAIPSEPDPSSPAAYGREGLSHSRTFLMAAVASLLIVGGAIIAIAHPWDPDLTNSRATTPADTSQAGFPGTVSKLQGQDSVSADATSVESNDEWVFGQLLDAYTQLETISARADELESRFDDKATGGTADERSQGASDAYVLAVDASNLVGAIENIDTLTTGTYTDQKDHVATLASWLRNRIDALNAAWKLSAASDDLSADATKIRAKLQGQRASDEGSYAQLFSKNFEAWAPEQRH